MIDGGAPVIVWDIDDVMNDLMASWFQWWREREAPNCPVTFEQLSENPPHERLGISQTTYLASLDAFRASEFAKLAPRADVLAWFRSAGDRAHHIALTAVPLGSADRSAAWLFYHFGTWIRTFAFVPSLRGDRGDYRRHETKAAYLKWLGQGDVFVDDRSVNVSEAEQAGLAGVLVPRPWNAAALHPFAAALDKVTALLDARSHA